MSICLNCGKKTKRSSYKYCSNKCQFENQYNEYINKWKSGIVNGSRGVNTKNISKYIQRYLFKKYNNKCAMCGWHEINPITGKVPLEVDHIDGNADHNKEENLRLICPNCHSLSSSFRNLNKGKGRVWRMKKYNLNKNILG